LTQYNIYHDIGQTGTFTQVVEADTSVFTFALTGQTTGVLIDFQVSSENSIGEAELSDLKTFPVASAPAAPAAPTSGGVYQSEFSSATVAIVVDWLAPATNGAAISGYQLFSAQGASGYSLIYDGTGRSDLLAYTHTGLTRGQSYHYKVLAINSIGASALSPSVTVLAAVGPGVPQDFTVTTSGSGTIDVSWTAPEYDGGSPLTGFYAYYRLPSVSTWTQSALLAQGVSTFQFTALTADTEYVLTVTAVNSEDESDLSDELYQFAGAVPTGLVAPTSVSTSRTSSSVTLQWSAPTTSTLDVIGYYLLINDADSNAEPSVVVYDGSSVPGTLSTTVYNLVSGSSYNFAIKALNSAGWSLLSDSLTLTAGNLPSPPSSAPTVTASSATQIDFEWIATEEIGGAALLSNYKVYVDGVLEATVSADVLSYSLTSVTAGNSYKITITAVTDVGEGIESLPATFWAVDVPTGPTFTVTGTTRDSCTFTWSSVAAPTNSVINGYVLLMDNGAGSEFSVAYNGATNPSVLEYTVEGLEKQLTYTVTGYAVNKAGNGVNATETTCFTAASPGQPGTPQWISSSDTHIEVDWEPAYDNGGSPLKEYQLYYDLIEGTGSANVETWTLIYNGDATTYTWSSPTALANYKFKVRAVSDQNLESSYSSIATFIAADVPDQITVQASPFTAFTKTSLTFEWDTLTIAATQIAIDSYKIYWDKGVLDSDNFELLAEVDSYD